jgi:hypothetical protein
MFCSSRGLPANGAYPKRLLHAKSLLSNRFHLSGWSRQNTPRSSPSAVARVRQAQRLSRAPGRSRSACRSRVRSGGAQDRFHAADAPACRGQREVRPFGNLAKSPERSASVASCTSQNRILRRALPAYSRKHCTASQGFLDRLRGGYDPANARPLTYAGARLRDQAGRRAMREQPS